MMQIGTQLRRIRQTRKQTLAEVGAATDLSASYLSKIERSLTEPTLGTLHKLSEHFDVSVSHFLDNSTVESRCNASHKPSFHAFIERMNGKVDDSMRDVLLRVDQMATTPADSVEEWLQYYYVISAVTSKG